MLFGLVSYYAICFGKLAEAEDTFFCHYSHLPAAALCVVASELHLHGQARSRLSSTSNEEGNLATSGRSLLAGSSD